MPKKLGTLFHVEIEVGLCAACQLLTFARLPARLIRGRTLRTSLRVIQIRDVRENDVLTK